MKIAAFVQSVWFSPPAKKKWFKRSSNNKIDSRRNSTTFFNYQTCFDGNFEMNLLKRLSIFFSQNIAVWHSVIKSSPLYDPWLSFNLLAFVQVPSLLVLNNFWSSKSWLFSSTIAVESTHFHTLKVDALFDLTGPWPRLSRSSSEGCLRCSFSDHL